MEAKHTLYKHPETYKLWSQHFVQCLMVGKFYLSLLRKVNLNSYIHGLFFIFCILGQNESGVAVHNGRIYLVGGYSIWTNEPLACIQVKDLRSFLKSEVVLQGCLLQSCYFKEKGIRLESTSKCMRMSTQKSRNGLQYFGINFFGIILISFPLPIPIK